MDAIYAGLTAWSIELLITALFLFILNREENKVISRRNKD
jgi:hypothetical protein|tara:strand:- start:15 stop:134 length:120 start_codon:yes stop_codon:yes gene_type:complete